MQVMPHKTFNLEENTLQTSSFFQPFTIDDTLRFTMLGKTVIRIPSDGLSFGASMAVSTKILVYDLSTGKIIDSVRLHDEGIHYAGDNIQGYYIHNMDSIYLYDCWQYTFILVNRRGEIIKKIDLSEKFLPQINSKITPSYPFPDMNMPIRRINNTFILQGMSGKVTGTKNIPTVTALCNLSDATVKFVNSYPEIYGNTKKLFKNWGIFSYLMVSYDLSNKGEMVLSYPADDHIAVYDIVSNTTRHYFAGYSKKDIIHKKKDNSKKDRPSELIQYLENTQYGNIHFDPYLNLYYRFVYHPSYDYDTNDGDGKNMSIIILDSEFNKVGEYDLQGKINMGRCAFVSEDGLHIQTLTNDSFMKFITLKPIKL
jgi:hypothetical protein